jgi:hypothetical protein
MTPYLLCGVFFCFVSCASRNLNEGKDSSTENTSNSGFKTNYGTAKDLGPAISISYKDFFTVGKVVQLECSNSQKIVDAAFGMARNVFDNMQTEYGSAACTPGLIFAQSEEVKTYTSAKIKIGLNSNSNNGTLFGNGVSPVPTLSVTIPKNSTSVKTQCVEVANSKYIDDFYFKTVQLEAELTAQVGCTVNAKTLGTGKITNCSAGNELKTAQESLKSKVKQYCEQMQASAKQFGKLTCETNGEEICPVEWKSPRNESMIDWNVGVSYDTLTGETAPRFFVTIDPALFSKNRSKGTLRCVAPEKTAQYEKVNNLLKREFLTAFKSQGCTNVSF